jgi:hypothetical protein
MGSNHRRLSRRFYRPLAPPAQVHAADQQRCAARRASAPSAPAPLGLRETRAGHGQGHARPRTADKEWSCHRRCVPASARRQGPGPRTHAENNLPPKPQPRPSREEASRPTPRGTASRDRNPARTNTIGLDHRGPGISTDSARGPETTGSNRHDSVKPDTRTGRPTLEQTGPSSGYMIGISAGQASGRPAR